MVLQLVGPALAAGARFLPAALATGGAVLGGSEAYKQSGGDIGAALLGAGGGALGLGMLPGMGRRMANVPAVKKATENVARQFGPEAYKASRMFSKTGTSTSNPIAQSMLGANILNKAIPVAGLGALGLTGLAVVPRMAGALATGTKDVAQAVGAPVLATGSETVQALQGDNFTVDPYTGQVVPNMPGLPGFAEYQNPLGPYQANLGYQRDLYRLSREEQAKQLSMLEPVIERAKTREMERQMAAARYRTDLGTQQGLVLQGQRGAQSMAERGLAGGIQGLTQQYTYG